MSTSVNAVSLRRLYSLRRGATRRSSALESWRTGCQAGSFVDDALAALGRSRRVALTVPHFLLAPHLLAASDLVTTLATRVARAFASTVALVTRPTPIELSSFQIAMVWHARTGDDPGLAWLREELRAVARLI